MALEAEAAATAAAIMIQLHSRRGSDQRGNSIEPMSGYGIASPAAVFYRRRIKDTSVAVVERQPCPAKAQQKPRKQC